MELRKIDFSKGSFECDGKKFIIRDSLSIERYKVLQQLSIEFGYSATFEDLFRHMRKVWDHLNKLELAEASVLVHNVMNGIQRTEQKYDVSLRMCALFIDEAEEDPSIYDEAAMNAKIGSWGKELDVLPFFHLAASLVPGWMPACKLVIQNTSSQAAAKS